MTVRIGMIGGGMIARVHAKAIAETGGRITAVCDAVQTKAQSFAEEAACEIEGSLDGLLRRDDVDAVVIALPNDEHAPTAIAAIEHGKHVLLEKPMATSLDACDAVLAARDNSDRILQLGFVCRYAPASVAARRLIAEGAIGSIHHVRATLLRQRGIPGLGGWFTQKARSGGGCLIDIGVHLIDLVQFLTEPGGATRASGHCSSLFGGDSYVYEEMWSEPHPGGVFDVEDSIRATVHFASGLRLDLDVAWATHLPEEVISDGIVLQGDLGAMSLDIWGDELLMGCAEEGRPASHVVSIDVSDAWDDAFVGEHRAFAEAIGTRQQPSAGGEAGRSVQAIVEAIYESDRCNKEVAIVN